jgi:hypothetical protein
VAKIRHDITLPFLFPWLYQVMFVSERVVSPPYKTQKEYSSPIHMDPVAMPNPSMSERKPITKITPNKMFHHINLLDRLPFGVFLPRIHFLARQRYFMLK